MRSDTATARELVEQLSTAGEKPPRWLLDAIRERGQDAVRPLIEVIHDYPFDEDDAEAGRYYAAHQAIQLLGDLRAAEAIAPLLSLLDEDDDYVDRYLPESLGKIGAPALEPLRAEIFAPDANIYGVARGSNALVALAERHPEHRDEIVRLLIERFEADIPSDEPETLRGFLVSDLADLRAVEAIPTVRRAYGQNRVDETIVSLASFRAIAERPEGVSKYDAPMPTALLPGSSPLSLFDAPSDETTGEAPADGLKPLPPMAPKVGRNDPCPCRSGKKFKRCHGK